MSALQDTDILIVKNLFEISHINGREQILPEIYRVAVITSNDRAAAG